MIGLVMVARLIFIGIFIAAIGLIDLIKQEFAAIYTIFKAWAVKNIICAKFILSKKAVSIHMIIWIIFIILGLLFFGQVKLTERGQVIGSFDDCIAAGNSVMESYPRQCRADEKTFVEDISQKCLPEQRSTHFCIALYEPVCAAVNIQCITTPCNPIKKTFSNSCEACKNNLVESYTNGKF